jgi:SAM-dependent methyltransferase
MSEKRPTNASELRQKVSEGYAKIARRASSRSSCCGGERIVDSSVSQAKGYSAEQLDALPDGADLGLGCGNPTAIDTLKPGEVVVDLGAGAGIDAFLAAREVGPAGRVIGVDMTDEMLARARRNAERGGYTNVEFRKGVIEDLPVEDASVDVIISNCVINLSPEKDRVFAEAFRVLKPGGRLMVSDIVLEHALPEGVEEDLEAYVGCIAGAVLRDDYLKVVRDAGFDEIAIVREATAASTFGEEVATLAARHGVSEDVARQTLTAVTSLQIRAVKKIS